MAENGWLSCGVFHLGYQNGCRIVPSLDEWTEAAETRTLAGQQRDKLTRGGGFHKMFEGSSHAAQTAAQEVQSSRNKVTFFNINHVSGHSLNGTFSRYHVSKAFPHHH